jgi:hypothetical protein
MAGSGSELQITKALSNIFSELGSSAFSARISGWYLSFAFS